MEKKRRKLQLARETVRTLARPQIMAAHGGTDAEVDDYAITIITASCRITCQRSCGGTCEYTCQYTCTGSAVVCCA